MLKGTVLIRENIQEKKTWKGGSDSKAEDQPKSQLQPSGWQRSLGCPAQTWTTISGQAGSNHHY